MAAARLDWVVRFRWVAVAGQCAVVLPALRRGWLEERHLPIYLLTVAALAGMNLLEQVVLGRRLRPRPRRILGHLAADLAGLTVLLVLSGGAWNPLAPLVFVHAILGPMLLGFQEALVLLALALATCAAITLLPVEVPALAGAPRSTWVTLSAYALVTTVTWSLTAWLSASLAAQRRLLDNLRQEQERMDRLRAAGALAAGVAHEFATPLNTIRLRLERSLRRGAGDPSDLEVALEAARRCGELLERMAGRRLDPAALRFETVDLVELSGQVCRSWARDERRVELRNEAGALPVRLPRMPFAQALLNLLDNAWEAMVEAGRSERGRVEVRLARVGDEAEVAVLDRGPGWPEVVRKHLGEPFLTTRPDGTGLGLYNAHGLARALGGRLHLLDRPGGGAVAALRLPLAEPAGEGG